MNTVLYKGKSVAFAEYGSPSGFPVLIQHGLIASIEDGHLFQPLVDAGLRLFCAARPGYGSSTPFALRNIAEWAAVTESLATSHSLRHFDILAMSSGAPYGYAIANGLRSRTRNLFIYSGTPALYDEEVRAVWPYPLGGHPTLPELQRLARELFFPGVSEDADVGNDVRDSMRNNCFGPALDLFLRGQDWGFSLSTVEAPVIMRHSRKDREVPFESARRTARLLRHCELKPDHGRHFSPEDLERFIRDRMLPLC